MRILRIRIVRSRTLRYAWDRLIDRLFYGGQFRSIIEEAYKGDLRID